MELHLDSYSYIRIIGVYTGIKTIVIRDYIWGIEKI